MYEMVTFFNDTDQEVTLTGVTAQVTENADGGTTTVNNEQTYGVCPPHARVTVPRFVGEYWARRNMRYHLEEDSDVARMIEKEKQDLGTTEDTRQRAAKDREQFVADEQKVREAQLASAEAIIRMANELNKGTKTPDTVSVNEKTTATKGK
jgi:hypothetical protein